MKRNRSEALREADGWCVKLRRLSLKLNYECDGIRTWSLAAKRMLGESVKRVA